MKKTKSFIFTIILSMLFCMQQFSQAALYNIDLKSSFPTYVGKGFFGTVSDSHWNGISNYNSANTPLVDSRNVSSALTFSSAGFAGSWNNVSTVTWGNFSDYWLLTNTSNTATITIKNVPVGEIYDLILFCHPGGNNRIMKASVNGSPQEATSGENTYVIQWIENPDAHSNYLRFSGIVLGDGIISINLACPGTESDIEGLQLQVGSIPMPAQGARTYKMIPDLAAGYDLKVMTIGTSLTDLPFGLSWPTQMNNVLFPKYQGHITLSNRAISGSNSKSGVDNIEAWLAADNPDVVFIEYAINDAVASDNISVASMKANLDFICAKILANNPKADIILQTMNNPVGPALTARPNIELYYQGYRDYATLHGYMLVDNYPLWKSLYDNNPSQWAVYVPDNIHPNDAGRSAVIINNLVSTLETPLTPDNSAPTTPTGLAAGAVGSTSVVLNWNASVNTVGATTYDIYKGNTKVGSTVNTTYTVTGVTANTLYSFTVVAKDGFGTAAATSPLVVTTGAPDLTPPTPPTGLSAVTITGSSVQLNWLASTDASGIAGYEVYEGATLKGFAAGNSFTVIGLLPTSNYSFTVKAKDNSNNFSTASASLQVTTLAFTVLDGITARGENAPNESLAKLTDSNVGTKWLDFSATSWVKFAYAEAKIWNTYDISSGDDSPERDPKNWTLEGSMDGTFWTVLDTRVDQTWTSRKQTRSFNFSNSTAYHYYKWDITANGGGTIIQVGEFKFPSLATGSGNKNQHVRMNVYPNPAFNELNFDFGAKVALADIRILDLQGRSLLTNSVANSAVHSIDVSKLSNGIYLVKITADGKQTNSKFVKK